MDFSILVSPNAIIIGFCTILLIWYCLPQKWGVGKKEVKIAPEAAGGWPIFGHLHMLKGPTPSHITLGGMADRYGPVFTVRLGSHQGLVVSSPEMAKECYTTNDLKIASRPSLLIAKHIGYDYAMCVFSPHGPFWREIRKIATVELLSNRRLELLKHIRHFEVATFLKELHKHWTANAKSENDGVLVEMKQWVWDLILNVVLRMVAGKRYSSSGNKNKEKESLKIQRAIEDFFNLFGAIVPGDVIPYLKWLDLGGYEKSIKKTAKELDQIFSEWLEEHKQKRNVVLKGGKDQNKDDQDFMDVMLLLLHGTDLGGYDADTINKATCLNLIAGGSDTTTGTVVWAISLLLNNRHVLKKVQEEIDSHVGKNRVVNESDISNLPYMQAIVKETLRLYPVAPLAGPRIFTEDCTVGGYHVSKGTRLITNLWKIQTDPKDWPKALEFKPERFLTTHKDVEMKGQHFEFIPFGSGRRACPGTTFALQMAHFALASFVHAFDITTPLNNAPVDMTESTGIVNIKVTPLELLITPRLPAHLYG
ncbi:cytochrome P450 CYP82D47-like [Humulus lupulus]|uniref:cytochrome P450 CYP82D47-like n=1 Tax=Humulus lupulus TaxID=3486 RepID=UPI002B403114|nr:cytochrome P450 CYP82D47-like [Humulus lupulus]